MSNYTTVVAFRRIALKRLRKHVLLRTHNLFPGAHFLNFWGLRGRKAGHSCQGFLQNWVIFYSNFKLRILQSWIILYILFRFWSHTVKYNFRNHDWHYIRGDWASMKSFANIQVLSFYTNWHEPTKVLYFTLIDTSPPKSFLCQSNDWFQYFTITCVGPHQPEGRCRRMLQDPQHQLSCIYNC